MADLKICRICLRTEAKVYKYDRFQLKPYYEEVMAIKVNEKDGLPKYFCYECATLLHKFHKFKEKCYTGQKVLKEILWKGSISYESIYKVDREEKHLQSLYNIITVNTRRVKTYTVKDDFDSDDDKPLRIESVEIDCPSPSELSIVDHDIHDNHDMDNDHLDDNPSTYPEEDKDLEINVEVEELKEETELETEQVESPKTIFVDIKKEAVELQKEEIREKKTKAVREGVKKFKFMREQKNKILLDEKFWKKVNLTEEEAVKEFRAKAEDRKYMAAAFKCTHCFRGFSKEEMLSRHLQLRHSESLGRQECRFCHMRFKWECQMRKHLRSHYTKFECQRCLMVCPLEGTALLHEEFHSGVTRKCGFCGEEFRHSSTYYTHLRTHRSDFVCALCGASFVSNMGLHQHKKVKHVAPDLESADDEEEVNTFCERCNIRFETRKAYEEHLFHSALHAEGVEDEVSEETIPRKVLGKKMQERITRELSGKWKSGDGPSVQISGSRKRRKIKRFHRKPTTCHQCGKHFDTQAACMKHHLSEHPRTSFHAPNDRYICEVCGASLAPGSIAVHQNMHKREKVFSCETCGKSFYASIGLKRHMVTHTGEKPFECSLCEKRFTQSNSMKLHFRTFHLKQPYPKRNRRKKKEDPQKDHIEVEESRSEDSDAHPETLRRLDPVPVPPPADNVHYLTLS